MNDGRTEISELGEFGLIKRLTEGFALLHPESRVGIGDDAAVIDSNGQQMVVSTDMLTEGVHFDLMYTPLKHLGYKAVVTNLSDICAMNAIPKQITVSIAVSNRFSVEALEELYAGIRKCCEVYQIDLVGGDTTSTTGGLTISITAIGLAPADSIVRRNTAKDKELIVVSGDLGGAFVGLQVLEREKEVYKEAPGAQPELDDFDYILERQLKPEARLDVVRHLKEIGITPSSMIDISDGLASEVLHLATESGLGSRLHEDKLPLDQQTYDVARDFNLDPTTCALNGGEDYELLFTISQDDYEKLKKDPHFTVIGYMTEQSEGNYLVHRDGSTTLLQAQGWNAFTNEAE